MKHERQKTAVSRAKKAEQYPNHTNVCKPTYKKDEEMNKIGETIGILNVNWEDVRAWKNGNRSIFVKDTPEFVAKDRHLCRSQNR